VRWRRWWPIAVLLGMMIVGVEPLIGSRHDARVSATGWDVLPAGQQYCADSYAGHPSYFGSVDGSWVSDINFPGDGGTPLRAPEQGTVTVASTSGGYGNAIVWTNGAGTEKLHMAHLSSIAKTGSVSSGDVIGYIGSTGNSSGPHLHISRWLNGGPAPVVLSGVTLNPAFRPDSTYGSWPCGSATYTSAGQAPSGGSGLTNGGFESGATGWKRINLPNNVNYQVYTDAGQARSGSRFMQANTSASGGSIGQDTGVVPQAGKYYHLRVWAKAASGGSATVTGALWALGGTQESATTKVVVGSAWTPIDVLLRPARSGHTQLRVEFYMQTTGRNINFDDASLTIANSDPRTYEASFVDQHAFRNAALTAAWDLSSVVPGQTGWLRFRVRNTGSQTWSRSGSNPVRLGTASPQDRSSPFRTSSWYRPNRPTAMKESTVRPGEVATFVFEVQIPSGMISAREHYRVVAEGRTWYGPVMWRDFSVPKCGAFTPTIVGSVDSETIEGTSGVDIIATFGGDDTIRGNGGDDFICAGNGRDTLIGGPGDDFLYGGGGSDTVVGQQGHDWVVGQGQNDMLVGGPGNDNLLGGAGRDTVKYSDARRGVTVDLTASTDITSGSAIGWGRDKIDGVAIVVGSKHADTLRGDNRANRLVGGDGADSLVGRGGTDVLVAGRGNDVLNGGPSRDVCNGQAGRDRAVRCEVRRSIP
jgi:Ca2+-binding RTX toxin-like protein